MRTYLIGYDLNKSGKDYADLTNAIKAESRTWWHHLDSTWIIKTNSTAVQIRDRLSKHIDNDDELLVVRLQGEWASKGFTTKGSDWLLENVTLE